jgi:hypothetical protein
MSRPSNNEFVESANLQSEVCPAHHFNKATEVILRMKTEDEENDTALFPIILKNTTRDGSKKSVKSNNIGKLLLNLTEKKTKFYFELIFVTTYSEFNCSLIVYH